MALHIVRFYPALEPYSAFPCFKTSSGLRYRPPERASGRKGVFTGLSARRRARKARSRVWAKPHAEQIEWRFAPQSLCLQWKASARRIKMPASKMGAAAAMPIQLR